MKEGTELSVAFEDCFANNPPTAEPSTPVEPEGSWLHTEDPSAVQLESSVESPSAEDPEETTEHSQAMKPEESEKRLPAQKLEAPDESPSAEKQKEFAPCSHML